MTSNPILHDSKLFERRPKSRQLRESHWFDTKLESLYSLKPRIFLHLAEFEKALQCDIERFTGRSLQDVPGIQVTGSKNATVLVNCLGAIRNFDVVKVTGDFVAGLVRLITLRTPLHS